MSFHKASLFLYNLSGSFCFLFSAFKTFPYKGIISLNSFLSARAPTIISAPPMLGPSPVQPLSPPSASSWHIVALWEDTIFPLPAGVNMVLSIPLLCCSGVGAGALIPLLPAPTLPPAPAPPPRFLVGGPQRNAWAGL